MSSDALGKLGVRDQTAVSKDVDTCNNKFRKWKDTSERASEALQPIQAFLKDMEIMIKNGLPCPWDENLKLYPLQHYAKIFKEATPGLINVLDKVTIPSGSEIFEQLKPCRLPPGPLFLD